MSTDRELLEAAALAAGISIYFDGVGQCCKRVPDEPLTTYLWNPIEDNYDAFALMVKLRMDVCRPHFGHDSVLVWSDADGDFIAEPHGADPYAATRRAIVRAAAAIGGAP